MILARWVITHELSREFYLIINFANGIVKILDRGNYQILDEILKGKIHGNYKFIDILLNEWFIFKSQSEEEKIFKQICSFREKVVKNIPVTLFEIYVTSFCNFKCPYCFESESARKDDLRLDIPSAEKIFDVIKKVTSEQKYLENRDKIRVKIFGGEPFLATNFEVIERILNLASNNQCVVDINTNGFGVEKYRRILKKYKEIINYIEIALDGPKEIHDKRRILRNGQGTFDVIVRNMDWLVENGINTMLRINVDGETIKHLDKYISFVRSTGWLEHKNFDAVALPVFDRVGWGILNLLREDQVLEALLPYSVGRDRVFNLEYFRTINHLRNIFESDFERRGHVSGRKLWYIEERTADYVPKIMYCEANYAKRFEFYPDGYIYPCGAGAIDSPCDEKLAIGRYLPKFEFFPERSYMVRKKKRTIMTIPQCRKCPIAFICGGGCVLGTLRHKNKFFAPGCDSGIKPLRKYLDFIKDDIIKKYCPSPADAAMVS